MNSKVDFYFNKEGRWQESINQLRSIVLACGLEEDLKWGCPCYTLNDRNIVLIHVFKEYCALLFFKGALLKDEKEILIQQTEKVQAARQLRFTNVEDVKKIGKTIKSYISEAIKVEKSGLKIPLKPTTEYFVPEEFERKLKDDSALKRAFEKLTPGRQRGYLLYFSEAKQSKTREARIEKSIDAILKGKGLND